MQKNTLKALRYIALMLLPMFALAACNEKTEDKDADTYYTLPTDVAITGYSLNANTKVLKGLDSVYFSIDLDKAVVFNADSLPKGTDVTKIVPKISYSSYISSAVIEMTGGKVRTGSVDYKKQPGDSIDFSGRVTITLTSTSGNSRAYELKLNVHQTEPDSLSWGKTALSALPSRSAAPLAQRTVQNGDKVVCMLQEADGSYTVAETDNPASNQWQKTAVSLPFTPRVRTLTACAGYLYMLGEEWLYVSADNGKNWNKTSGGYYNIVGAYDSSLLVIDYGTPSGLYMVRFDVQPDGSLKYVDSDYIGEELADFPVEDFTNLYCYQSKWMQSPLAVLAGGVTQEGKVSDKVWGYDGNSWVVLSSGQLPALRGATLIPYYSYLKPSGVWMYNEYSTLLLAGGMDSEGKLNKDLYLSYNNGVGFSKGSELMQLPSFIPGMWDMDNVVSSVSMQQSVLPQGWTQMPDAELKPWFRVQTTLDGTTVKWECPYIYLFGGRDADGKLYDTVWRGVINRLTFSPII